MKKLILFLFLICPAIAVQAQSSGVLQLFACKLDPGKTGDNVWSVLEMTRANLDRSAPDYDPGFGIFVWTPFRQATGYDYIWGIVNTDLESMAAGAKSYVESGNAAIMGPRFANLGSCDSSVVFYDQLTQGELGSGEDRIPDAAVETFSCNFRGDADMEDVEKASEYWLEQIGNLDSPDMAKYRASLLMPFRGGTGAADFGWVGNYPDWATFARASTAYVESKEGQAADARFDRVSRCQSALWNGYWVVEPQEMP